MHQTPLPTRRKPNLFSKAAESSSHKKKWKFSMIVADELGSSFFAVFLVFYAKLRFLHYKNHAFFSFLLLMNLCVPAVEFLFISLFFLTYLPHLHQNTFHCFYDSCFASLHSLCFFSSTAFYNRYHLCIHIQYYNEDHLDSVASSDSDTLP